MMSLEFTKTKSKIKLLFLIQCLLDWRIWWLFHLEIQDATGTAPVEAARMIKGLEHMSYEERLGELDLLSLEKRKAKGAFITACNYLMGGYRVHSSTLFSNMHGDRRRGKVYKLERGWFWKDTRKNLHHEGGQALEQEPCSCGISIAGDIQNSVGHDPE